MSEKIKFAHLADLHLGSWREKTLHDLNLKTFEIAIDKIIEEKFDFCLFAGDIFNSALPSLDLVEKVVKTLIKLKKSKIPLYVIGGSHDYSLSQKSFIDILETAQVFKDVGKYKKLDKEEIELKFTKDEKTGTILAGILGKKNGLDKNIYNNLNQKFIENNSFSIFMFHTTLNDIKPDFLKNIQTPVTSKYLPEGFNYYAGGHVHSHIYKQLNEKSYLSYPGALFPNNFSELKREIPSFNSCTFNNKNKKLEIKREFIQTYKTKIFSIELNKETPLKAKEKIEKTLFKENIKNKIVLLEIKGIIDGKISEIEISKITQKIYELGALQVLKNTFKLTTTKIKEISIDKNIPTKEIEKKLINQHSTSNNLNQKEIEKIKNLFSLDLEKNIDETNSKFEQRINIAIKKTLE